MMTLKYQGITGKILEFCTTPRSLDQIMKQFDISENIAKIFLIKLSELEEENKIINVTTDEVDTIVYQTIIDPALPMATKLLEEYLKQEDVSDYNIQEIVSSFEQAKSTQEKRDVLESALPSIDIEANLHVKDKLPQERKSGLREDLIRILVDPCLKPLSFQDKMYIFRGALMQLQEGCLDYGDVIRRCPETHRTSKERKSRMQKGLIEFLMDAGLSTKSINSILEELQLSFGGAGEEVRLLLTKQGVSWEVISWILGNL